MTSRASISSLFNLIVIGFVVVLAMSPLVGFLLLEYPSVHTRVNANFFLTRVNGLDGGDLFGLIAKLSRQYLATFDGIRS